MAKGTKWGFAWCQGQATSVDGAPAHHSSRFFIFIPVLGTSEGRELINRTCRACVEARVSRHGCGAGPRGWELHSLAVLAGVVAAWWRIRSQEPSRAPRLDPRDDDRCLPQVGLELGPCGHWEGQQGGIWGEAAAQAGSGCRCGRRRVGWCRAPCGRRAPAVPSAWRQAPGCCRSPQI